MDNFIKSLLQPEQWAMSSADNEWGLSLPEHHPEYSPISEAEINDAGTVEFGIGDTTPDWATIINNLMPHFKAAQPYNADALLSRFQPQPNKEDLANAQIGLFTGAAMKTFAAADDFFTRATGLAMGQLHTIDMQADAKVQAYQNEMDALDNKVLYIKHQLSDRFNRVVESNIMNMAAKNIRVTSGGTLELSKDIAQEMTEDMRTAESNARLKQIAYTYGKKQAKESARYAKFQAVNGFIQSAAKLGMAISSGGGTGESWGNLYAGYKQGKEFFKMKEATEAQEFNKLY